MGQNGTDAGMGGLTALFSPGTASAVLSAAPAGRPESVRKLPNEAKRLKREQGGAA